MVDGHIQMKLLMATPFVLFFASYITAVKAANRKHKAWPRVRILFMTSGVIAALISIVGTNQNFVTHMISHLLLGMLAPLLLVLAAPMTLILRTLPVYQARQLSRVLRSRLTGFYTNPAITTILNIGGLWVLYTTGLYNYMQENTYVHLLVMLHVFLAAYLFTASFVYVDPNPHRFSYIYRSIVLTIALAGHGILSKVIYANPPAGVPKETAETGAMMMYYGGDLIDAVIIFMLCYDWFRATRPSSEVTA